MKKVIRLTENDLALIVKRVINESQSAQIQKIKSMAAESSSCFDCQKIPTLCNFAKGYGLMGVGILSFVATYFTVGIADGVTGGLLVTTGIFATAAAADKFAKAFNAQKSTLMGDMDILWDCMTDFF
jgi:hypothetical protein